MQFQYFFPIYPHMGRYCLVWLMVCLSVYPV